MKIDQRASNESRSRSAAREAIKKTLGRVWFLLRSVVEVQIIEKAGKRNSEGKRAGHAGTMH
jgi:hypothetical protein